MHGGGKMGISNLLKTLTGVLYALMTTMPSTSTAVQLSIEFSWTGCGYLPFGAIFNTSGCPINVAFTMGSKLVSAFFEARGVTHVSLGCSMAVGLYFCARTLIFAFVRPSTLNCNNVTHSSMTKVSVRSNKGACLRLESD